MQTELFKISELKAVYYPDFKLSDRPGITSSSDAYDIFFSNWDEGSIQHRESFYILLLSRSNCVLAISEISKGGVSGTVADPKMIFQKALLANASSIIIAHNHPSGNIKPSENDTKLTKNIINDGKLLEINVLDHLIISQGSYFSFADEGLI